MYFDIHEGFIGFDDKEGNEWRLKKLKVNYKTHNVCHFVFYDFLGATA
jgi:hypothetical protein